MPLWSCIGFHGHEGSEIGGLALFWLDVVGEEGETEDENCSLREASMSFVVEDMVVYI